MIDDPNPPVAGDNHDPSATPEAPPAATSSEPASSEPASSLPPVKPEPAAPQPNSTFGAGMDANQWAMLLHLSQLLGLAVPVLGLAAPIVIWQIKKAEFPALEAHGVMVANWIISLLIYVAVGVAVSMITCGIGVVLSVPIFAVLTVLSIVFPIIGGLKARDGVLWDYPATIKFIK